MLRESGGNPDPQMTWPPITLCWQPSQLQLHLHWTSFFQSKMNACVSNPRKLFSTFSTPFTLLATIWNSFTHPVPPHIPHTYTVFLQDSEGCRCAPTGDAPSRNHLSTGPHPFSSPPVYILQTTCLTRISPDSELGIPLKLLSLP
ncbi:hypothetical protein SKAU_G00196370 [Synaphobranchus kaupii]|uniref:Uncharacterized protein n=1 Tax=Synaphobranchus kaupii TaxID=118154 RepID=A0A9Q1IXR7_SYNKA|nr:hypothetical protein SKAU_G00196370 [Synaphobranchus kaupii]